MSWTQEKDMSHVRSLAHLARLARLARNSSPIRINARDLAPLDPKSPAVVGPQSR